MQTKELKTLRVSATTRPQDLAGAIAKYITQDHQDIKLHCIGAGAQQQCVKAMIIARRYVSSAGIDLGYIPAFESTEIKGKEVTVIAWRLVHLH